MAEISLIPLDGVNSLSDNFILLADSFLPS